MNVYNTNALEAAIAARHEGTLSESQKSLLYMSTDAAGQEKLAAEFGWPFPS